MAVSLPNRSEPDLTYLYKQLSANISILQAENTQLLQNIDYLESSEQELISSLHTLQDAVSLLNQETLKLRQDRDSALEDCRIAKSDLETTVHICRTQTREMKFQLTRLEVKK